MKFTVRGTVLDAATNRGADGVKVDLRQQGGATVASVFTANSGEFSFTDVGSGTYEITVAEVGYEPIDQQVSVEDSTFGLQLRLRKASNQPAGTAGATISVRELSIPRKAHDFMLKAVTLLYEKNDDRGSIEQFQRAIKEYPGYYEAYAQMAVAYLNLGEMANSEEALKKSIDVSQQRYSEAYFALAGLYLDAKRFADAEPIARKATELDDASWKGHYELATALFGLDRWPEAEIEARAATERDGNGPETHLLLANVHLRLHDYSAVLADLDAYLKLDPNGTLAERARHLHEQVQAALQKSRAEAEDDDSAGADDGPAEGEAPDAP